MLNELAIEAAKTGVEQITDEAVERWKPTCRAVLYRETPKYAFQ